MEDEQSEENDHELWKTFSSCTSGVSFACNQTAYRVLLSKDLIWSVWVLMHNKWLIRHFTANSQVLKPKRREKELLRR